MEDEIARKECECLKNELLSIGPFTIYGYGLMIGIGIIMAYLSAEFRAKKRGMESGDRVLSLVIWCVVGGMLGAKLLYWITQYQEILADPSVIWRNLADGFVVYGGILGGIFTGWLYCRVTKIPFLKYFDLFMPSIALAQGFGRIGCFLAGCCYGRSTDSRIGITFTDSAFAPNGVPLIPTQLISSALNFLHFGLLLWLAPRCKADGQLAGCYLMFYSAGRFILEFFRGDLERGSVGILSTSQFISVFTFLAGVSMVIFFGWRQVREKKVKEEESESH